MTINLCGAIFAVVIFLASGVAMVAQALRAAGRNRLIMFLTACLSIAAGILIAVFYLYDERVLFPR